MKRLLEETSDQFERSMLQAGSDVQPDGAHKRRLLAALAAGTLVTAAGGSMGHAATSVWWKGFIATKVGKLTLASLVVAGASTAVVTFRAEELQPSSQRQTAPSQMGAPEPTLPSVAYSAGDLEIAMEAARAGAVSEVAAPASSAPTTGSTPTVVRTRPTKAERSEKSAPVPSTSPVAPTTPSAIVLEARLVERIRNAIHAGEGSTVRQLVREYHRNFPMGQLRPEVNKLETQWHGR